MNLEKGSVILISVLSIAIGFALAAQTYGFCRNTEGLLDGRLLLVFIWLAAIGAI